MLDSKLDMPDRIHTTEIITFNTLKLKGAIKDVARGLELPLEVANEVSSVVREELNEQEQKVEVIDDVWRQKYPELFKYVDLVLGISTSVGAHASGVVVSDLDLDSEIGTCYIANDDYPVSCLTMKQLDALNFVKEDALSLDNVTCINETCANVGIAKLSAKDIDLNDDNVWDSIKEDTSLIFEMNSPYGQRTMQRLFSDSSLDRIRKQIPNITKFDLLAYANALIRPCGKGVYEKAVNGEGYVSGIEDIDKCLSNELGFPIMQESQMRFVQEFCGYSFLQADKLRKIIGKKLGTKDQLPIVKQAFEENAKIKYNLSDEKSDEIIGLFNQCLLDASNYSFSSIHSYSYSYISYECGWLRYYYPLQYLTSCLNAWDGNDKKTAEALSYADKIKVSILPPKFRHSKAEYFYDESTNSIYKGVGSIKNLNVAVSNELYGLRNNTYNTFVDLLKDISFKTSTNSRQLDILIKLDYFSEFGTQRELLQIVKIFDEFKVGAAKPAKSIKKDKYAQDTVLTSIISRHSNGLTKAGKEAKSWSVTDMDGLIAECEEYIRSLRLGDLPMKMQIKNQIDFTGYIGIKTGKAEDRPRVIVLDKKILKSKDDGKPWACVITGQSIGSGKKTEYTIPYKIYQKATLLNHKEDIDIIHILDWYRNKKGYFYVTKYEVEI